MEAGRGTARRALLVGNEEKPSQPGGRRSLAKQVPEQLDT